MDKNGDAIIQVLGVFSMSSIYYIKVDYYFISVGLVMVLLGVLGLFGAKKESKCLLITVSKSKVFTDRPPFNRPGLQNPV